MSYRPKGMATDSTVFVDAFARMPTIVIVPPIFGASTRASITRTVRTRRTVSVSETVSVPALGTESTTTRFTRPHISDDDDM